MTDWETLLSLPPYGMGREEKHPFLTRELAALCRHHQAGCPSYARMLSAWSETEALAGSSSRAHGYEGLPFLPVRLFKEFDLFSVPEESLHKTLTSSGTTGQQVSRIHLDRETSAAQSKVLTIIVRDFLGNSRLPMIILDTSALLQNRAMFSARGAGVLGFSLFARDKIYAFDEHMNLDVAGLRAFLEKHRGEPIFLFGFTYMVWRHFYGDLRTLAEPIDLSQGILIHGGGWKKLAAEAVSPSQFQNGLKEVCGIRRVHDYYGMVEQTGAIFMECEKGHLHAPVWADILVRSPRDFSLAPMGEKGLIEAVSLLPRSYPGHLLLTEDEGRILGEDDCPCGRKGKYFQVLGRIQRAEARGCSDTYEPA
ncbi:MAG: acyl-protein synthetase [Clostridia bacterium]|nr:acyl-protein synthetase [Clostridia bacterium]